MIFLGRSKQVAGAAKELPKAAKTNQRVLAKLRKPRKIQEGSRREEQESKEERR